jgi:hypothetical protein
MRAFSSIVSSVTAAASTVADKSKLVFPARVVVSGKPTVPQIDLNTSTGHLEWPGQEIMYWNKENVTWYRLTSAVSLAATHALIRYLRNLASTEGVFSDFILRILGSNSMQVGRGETYPRRGKFPLFACGCEAVGATKRHIIRINYNNDAVYFYLIS